MWNWYFLPNSTYNKTANKNYISRQVDKIQMHVKSVFGVTINEKII